MGATKTAGKNPPAVKIPTRGFISSATETEKAAAKEDEGQQLSPAARIFRQPQFNCHIIAILGMGKFIRADELKAGLEATLVRHPRFSSVQVTDLSGSDKPRWVPTKVNLDNHVIYPDISDATTAAAADDPVVGDRFVEDYTSGLYHSPLDPSHPLWDLHFLPIRTSEATCVGVFRIHHSLGDGISLMSLFLACTRRTSDYESLPSLPAARRRSAAAVSGFGPWVLLFWIWTFLVYAWNTLVHAFLFVASAFFLKDTRTRIMGSEGVEFRPKRFVHRTLSLDDIKDIKNAMGCTINDVLVGVTSAALSRYLSRSYDGCLPKNLRIRTSLLVNIRPTPGINALAEMMRKGSGAKWGNQMGYMLLRFPVMECEDPLDYIRKGMAVVEKKKKSWEAIFTYISSLVIVKTLGFKVGTILCHRIVSNTSLSFSNIVGPMEEVGFCGSPLVYIAPSVYGHPQALTIHFQSYLNKMKVVLAVDELVIPDPHKLLDDISHSLQIIKDAITRF
ncbi:O-acyltransferase WSD1 [Dendrobium catenatum]|uniref:O-acyltransferase WSD1 n=1 Tax=Dendrobium catenatum TaxID=906689 RepID=UPI0009F35F9C|nr:O-acyltransferase WSD1 [Dendrobium catenatum]